MVRETLTFSEGENYPVSVAEGRCVESESFVSTVLVSMKEKSDEEEGLMEKCFFCSQNRTSKSSADKL
jgi:hypothetical protein